MSIKDSLSWITNHFDQQNETSAILKTIEVNDIKPKSSAITSINSFFQKFKKDWPSLDWISNLIHSNVVAQILTFFNDYLHYLLLIVILIIFFIFTKKYLRVKQSQATEINQSCRTKDSPFNRNVFDLAKTAYQSGHTEAVIHLIETLQYDVNATLPSNGLSLFLCACLSGKKPLISYMIKKGAVIQARTEDGDSALYLATYGILNSENSDTSVLELLIREGCCVNQQNNKGYTPLHRASSKGNLKVIKCLLKYGADRYQANYAGVYPIDSAINAGHRDAAELLKINIANPHVWDLVEPHTPPRIQLGLQSPNRHHLMESTKYKRSCRVFP